MGCSGRRPRRLAGVDRILHAGDVGAPDILTALRRIAPVEAVRGNVDYGVWADALPLRRDLLLMGSHCLIAFREDARPADADVVVFGHSHRPLIDGSDGVLWINPGSAGPRRFQLPVTVGLLETEGGEVKARLIELR